ncbi:hypothetical protein AO372_0909 [Moraxella catarrhalis]|nr:hypothetical protein AO372_0909 [Moraxella catarrhalis]
MGDFGKFGCHIIVLNQFNQSTNNTRLPNKAVKIKVCTQQSYFIML